MLWTFISMSRDIQCNVRADNQSTSGSVKSFRHVIQQRSQSGITRLFSTNLRKPVPPIWLMLCANIRELFIWRIQPPPTPGNENTNIDPVLLNNASVDCIRLIGIHSTYIHTFVILSTRRSYLREAWKELGSTDHFSNILDDRDNGMGYLTWSEVI